MKKYRTKSGKVEEKLPGVNATVSKSEKAQIAMAGGADTIADVQAILGTPGKKNNLKGQGAKHLMSFQWGDESWGAPGGEEESTTFGSEPSTSEDVSAMSSSSRDYTPATSGFAPSDIGESESFIPDYTDYSDPSWWKAKRQRDFEKTDPSLLDRGLSMIDPVANWYDLPIWKSTAVASGVGNLAIGNFPGAALNAAQYAYLSNLTAPAEEDTIPMPGMTSKEAEDYADKYATTDLPNQRDGQNIQKPIKRKKIKTTSVSEPNKVTLATSEEDTPTRQQLRRARFSTMRFA